MIALSSQAYDQFIIKQNKVKTIGIVKKITVRASRSVTLYYIYVAEKDTFHGHVGVDYFELESLRLNCLNKKFNVYYSAKNPNNSMIDLGKYNDSKTTVEFFKPY